MLSIAIDCKFVPFEKVHLLVKLALDRVMVLDYFVLRQAVMYYGNASLTDSSKLLYGLQLAALAISYDLYFEPVETKAKLMLKVVVLSRVTKAELFLLLNLVTAQYLKSQCTLLLEITERHSCHNIDEAFGTIRSMDDVVVEFAVLLQHLFQHSWLGISQKNDTIVIEVIVSVKDLI